MKLSLFSYKLLKKYVKRVPYIFVNLLETEKMQQKDDAVIINRLSKLAFVLTMVHLETSCQHWWKLNCYTVCFWITFTKTITILFFILPHLCKQEIGVFLVLLMNLKKKNMVLVAMVII